MTAKEIRCFRFLTWLQPFGRPGPKSVLNPPPDEPILDLAIETAFQLLADQPNREIVVGTVVIVPRGWKCSEPSAAQEFKDLKDPGFALAAMSFLIEETKPGVCELSTRDEGVRHRRRFAAAVRGLLASDRSRKCVHSADVVAGHCPAGRRSYRS